MTIINDDRQLRLDLVRLNIHYSSQDNESDTYEIVLQDDTKIVVTKYELKEIAELVQHIKEKNF